MPRPLPAALLAAAALAAGLSLAPRPLAARNGPNGGGEAYAVAGGAVPVLYHPGTGESWALARLAPGEHVWLPCDRVTDPERVAEIRETLAADPAPPGGPRDPRASADSPNVPAGGAYFPGDLLGGDLIGGDLIGGDLIGGNAIDGDLIGGNVVGKDLLEGELRDGDGE